VRALTVVKSEVLLELSCCFPWGLIGFETDFLVLHTAPSAFHKHFVDPTPFAIHADDDPGFFEDGGEGVRCKLQALIRMENLRRAVLN